MKHPPRPELGNPPTEPRPHSRRLLSWLAWVAVATVVAGLLQEARSNPPPIKPPAIRHIVPGSPLLNPSMNSPLVEAISSPVQTPPVGPDANKPAVVVAARPTPSAVAVLVALVLPLPSAAPRALPLATWASSRSTPSPYMQVSAPIPQPGGGSTAPRPQPSATSTPTPRPTSTPTPSSTPTPQPTPACVPKASEARGNCKR